MTRIDTNGIYIECDTFGDASNPALVLIMGLSGQMILWDEDLCRGFADRGLYVIRFDNRDTGLSAKIEDPVPMMSEKMLAAAFKGEKIHPPYTLGDMALDAFGLMDGLGVKQAHVLGASMGGMIAQTMAVMQPDRILSLTSLSSATGNPDVGAAVSPDIGAAGASGVDQGFAPLQAPPSERSAYIDYLVNGMRELSGPGYAFDDNEARVLAARCYDRCYYPQGTFRQLMAIMASGNRRPSLCRIAVPTLVIHGDCDPLVPVEAGIDTAEAIRGAKLKIIAGMGHDLPRQVWPEVINSVCRHIENHSNRNLT